MDYARRHFFPQRFQPPRCVNNTRGKTKPSQRSLSFPPNFKPSRALNHRQSDLQEAPVCQPCPPAMEISRGIIFVGPQLLIFGVKIENYWRWILFVFPYLFEELANNKF
jgi:hypothetical protein